MSVSFNFNFADWQLPLLDYYQYKVLYGGRGGGKSFAIAEALLLLSMKKKCIILCGREFQNSIKQSVHSLLKLQIQKLGLQRYFKITRDEIVCKLSKTTFYFYGFNRNIDAIKSIPDIKYLWIEEAAKVTVDSWEVIDATVRDNKSEIWISFNPDNINDVIYRNFVIKPPTNIYSKYLTFRDNLHLNKSLDLLIKAHNLKTSDYEKYLHVYEGHCRRMSDAIVFKDRFTVLDFVEPENVYPYYGLDFGFSENDPTVGIRCYIHEDRLYITHEAYMIKPDINDIGRNLEKYLPNVKKYQIKADSANPAVINHIKKQRYNIKGVEKGKGSVEDGIEYMKSLKPIIHPRCKETIKEFNKHTYKVESSTGYIFDIFVDKDNHCIDATRYAILDKMRGSNYWENLKKIKPETWENLANSLASRRYNNNW